MFRSIIRELILETVSERERIANLQPDDILTLYHGTGESYLSMIFGVDATEERGRSYGGPRHKGLFVTPDFKTALRFASYGAVVLEIETLASQLYGTNWSGDTGEDYKKAGQRDPNDIWRDRYPNSFRPFLSAMLLDGGNENQALLIGRIRPTDIKRVYWKGEWYTPDELFDLEPEYHEPYQSTPTKLKRKSFDPTEGDISIEEFVDIVHREEDIGKEEIMRTLEWRSKRPEKLYELIINLGWRPSAARQITQNIVDNAK